MLAKKVFGIPIVAVAATMILGFLIGSIGRLGPGGSAEEVVAEAKSTSEADRAAKDASGVVTGRANSPVVESYTEPDSEFILGAGALLKPARVNGVFVGFEILKAGNDKRLDEGSVIVSVNGMPVEDSAAGSEILAAALASDDSQIVLAPKAP